MDKLKKFYSSKEYYAVVCYGTQVTVIKTASTLKSVVKEDAMRLIGNYPDDVLAVSVSKRACMQTAENFRRSFRGEDVKY